METQKNYPAPAMRDVILFSLLGLGGCLFYFFSIKAGFILCSVLCLLLFAYNLINGFLRSYCYAFLAACAVVAYMFSHDVWDMVLLAGSFYYALVWILPIILAVLPEIIVLLIVGLIGIIFGLCGYNWVLFPCGAYCLTTLLFSAFQGKIRPHVYAIIASALAIAFLGVFNWSGDDRALVKIVKVLSYTACLTYPLVALYLLVYKMVKGTYKDLIEE